MRKFAQNSQKTLNDPKLYIHPKTRSELPCKSSNQGPHVLAVPFLF